MGCADLAGRFGAMSFTHCFERKPLQPQPASELSERQIGGDSLTLNQE
jgi:hypothetical protein